MSYILHTPTLTHKVSQCLFNIVGTHVFETPNWANYMNVVCVGGGGSCGGSSGYGSGSSGIGGAGGGGGALAFADMIPIMQNDIITIRVAGVNFLTSFSSEQTSFVQVNSNIVAEASSGLRGNDLSTPQSLSSYTAGGGAGGTVIVGQGGDGTPGSVASSPAREIISSSPFIEWRKYQGGVGGGAGGYDNPTGIPVWPFVPDIPPGGGGRGSTRLYRYVVGIPANNYSFHFLTAGFSGGGVGLFGIGNTGSNGSGQSDWDRNNSSTWQPDNYAVLSGSPGSNGIQHRYGAGRGGSAAWRTVSGGSFSTWRSIHSTGLQPGAMGGPSQIAAGTGAVRIEFLQI